MNFELEVEEASKLKPVLVQFTASWCGPCRIMKPAVKAIEKEREDVDVKIVDVDSDVGVPVLIKYGVRGVPLVVMFKDGKVVSRYMGHAVKSTINKWIDQNI